MVVAGNEEEWLSPAGEPELPALSSGQPESRSWGATMRSSQLAVAKGGASLTGVLCLQGGARRSPPPPPSGRGQSRQVKSALRADSGVAEGVREKALCGWSTLHVLSYHHRSHCSARTLQPAVHLLCSSAPCTQDTGCSSQALGAASAFRLGPGSGSGASRPGFGW